MSDTERLEATQADPTPPEGGLLDDALSPPSEQPTETSREPSATLEEAVSATPSTAPGPSPAPHTIEPPVPSGPYRTPPHEVRAPAPKPPTRPYVGAAVASFGPMLWSFVVAGQFTTSWSTGKPLAQGIAVAAVFVTTLVAWIVAMRRSHHAVPAASKAALFGRSLVVGLCSFALFVVAIVAATAFGAANPKSHDFLIAFGLVAIAMGATIAGPKLTTSEPPARTHGQKFVAVALWVLGALVTLVAGVDLATNG